MSQVKISGDPSGTGVFTISAPNSNTNRALVLPDSAGTIATAESTLAQFSATGSAPVFACRAWVNFNGTGTVAIRASGNVSSITDNGTGDYTVNFTTAMPDVNYAVFGNTTRDPYSNGTLIRGCTPHTLATGSVKVPTFNTTAGGASSAEDLQFISVSVFR